MDTIKTEFTDKKIYEIAQIIKNDWKNVNYAAKPYLEAMFSLSDINDDYGCDHAKSIILYFISNASSWRGPLAKVIKAHLNKLVKS